MARANSLVDVHLHLQEAYIQLPKNWQVIARELMNLLGDRIMEAAQSINEAIDRLAGVVETEAGEIAAMIHPGMTQAETDAIIERLDSLGERVKTYAPTPMPEPPVDPTA